MDANISPPTFRVAVIEVHERNQDISADLVIAETSNLEDLDQYFSRFAEEGESCRIVIVEQTNTRIGAPNTPLERLLIRKINIDPDVFDEHRAQGPMFNSDEEHIKIFQLPTALLPEQRWHINDFELYDYNGPTEQLQWPCPRSKKTLCPGDEGLTLCCESTGQQLQFHKWRTRPGWLIVAPRKCSFWSRRRGACWDAMFLCDPPPRRAVVMEANQTVNLTPQAPFRGGYQELIPRCFLERGTLSGPTAQALRIQDDHPHHGNRHAPNQRQLLEAEPGGDQAVVSAMNDTRPLGALIPLQNMRNGPQVQNAVHGQYERHEGQDHPPPAPDAIDIARQQLLSTVAPKTSMFEDMRYYFARYSSLLETLRQPTAATIFPLKLIASHYCLLHAFINFQTATMRSSGWALKRESPDQIQAAHQVETSWSRFRCSEYLEAIEAVLDTLGIPYDEPPLPKTFYNQRRRVELHRERSAEETPAPDSTLTNWRSSSRDFLFLHRQFHLRRLDYDRITTSIAALMSIITGRLSVTEAQTVRTLTYVAMCFAPLGWVAGVFSMSEKFGPKEPLFWQYWATALPVTLGVWLIFLVWHKGWKLRYFMMRRRIKEAPHGENIV